MKVRPIIFSTPMVRALLDGRKTQTRRLITSPLAKCEPGDLLYVRESWKPVHSNDPSRGARYRVDAGADHSVWRPSIHLPRWASRLTLEVTERRAQKLHWITDEDAIAEGIYAKEHPELWRLYSFDVPGLPGVRDRTSTTVNAAGHEKPVSAFRHLWELLHGARSWDANPEVVALTFKVHKVNVDKMGAATA